MKRQATYTVSIPLQFTFVSDDEIRTTDFLRVAQEELLKRLENGYFDVKITKLIVEDKETHYTREEKIAKQNSIERLLRGYNKWRLLIQELLQGDMTL